MRGILFLITALISSLSIYANMSHPSLFLHKQPNMNACFSHSQCPSFGLNDRLTKEFHSMDLKELYWAQNFLITPRLCIMSQLGNNVINSAHFRFKWYPNFISLVKTGNNFFQSIDIKCVYIRTAHVRTNLDRNMV